MLKNEIALSSAITFVKAFEVLDTEQKKNISTNNSTKLQFNANAILLTIPLIVVGTLACELLIKSFLQPNTMGHKLNELFNNSDFDEKLKNFVQTSVIQIIKDNFNKNYNEDLFNQELNQNANNFVKWRYFHEQNRTDLKASFIFIGTLMQVLKEVALAEKKNKGL